MFSLCAFDNLLLFFELQQYHQYLHLSQADMKCNIVLHSFDMDSDNGVLWCHKNREYYEM